MRKIETKNYLVIGCVHQGASKAVLDVLSTFASNLEAEVVHLGSLATEDEIKMYNRRLNKIRTWERQQEQANKRIDALQEQAKSVLKDDSIINEKKATRLLTLMDAAEQSEKIATTNIAIINKEISQLRAAQDSRIAQLEEAFDSVHFVSNREQHLDGDDTYDSHLDIGRYLRLESCHPTGMRVTGDPLSEVALLPLRKHSLGDKRSVVVPHPTSRLRSYATPGINNSFSYITTGCLHGKNAIHRPIDRHNAVNGPAAVLISVDQETGEFHAVRVLVMRNRSTRALMACVDDMAFTSNSLDHVKNVYTMSNDVHAPYHSEQALAGLLAAQSLLPNITAHIVDGDGGDLRPVCPHIANNLLEREGLRLNESLDSVENYLIQTGSRCPVWFLLGNHEKWLDLFIQKNPQLQGTCDWETMAAKWKIKVIRDNKATPALTIADGTIRHGHQESVSAGAKLFEAYVCGHGHRRDEIGRAYMAPAACNEEALEYVDGAITSAMCGFTVLAVFGNRLFVTPHITLWSKDRPGYVRFSFRGQIYEVAYGS